MEDRLQKFAHLVDAGSFTKASQDLHISQPALSMSIQKLERELRAQLYVKGSHPLTLTPAGTRAYQGAKELGASVKNLHLALSEIAQQEVSLSIGMIDSIADIMLANPRTIRMLEAQAKVSLAINNSRYLLQALSRGDIDVAIIAEQLRPLDHTFYYENIGAEPLVVAVHKHKKDALLHELASGSLKSFISYDQPSRTHAVIEQFFANQDVYVSPQFFSSSPEVIYRLLLAQKGAAALPYRRIRTPLRAGTLTVLHSNAVIPRRISLVTRRNYQQPRLLNDAVANLRVDLAKLLTEASELR